ncbi:unnamed protein product [Paramecium sonneborni]|uniref:Calcium load-activated calcium channel n=1 Tax=Paramecium sonneborni TaxID=65129 RepID=A0A8S1L7R3_9CILI|nr:unnamed protein product [Paramecium sonneborni]
MDINIGETLFIIIGAAISISVGELVSWFLVYRNEDYKDLVSRIETAVAKYNKEKESFVKETNAKNQEKRLSQIESQIKGLNYEMTFKKMISNAAVAILSIVTINSIGNYYSGIVVAKLPFEPFWILQQITHRGLNGEDLTDCSYIFIYVLSALIFKSNIQKIFGLEGPKMPFGPGGPQPSLFKQ